MGAAGPDLLDTIATPDADRLDETGQEAA